MTPPCVLRLLQAWFSGSRRLDLAFLPTGRVRAALVVDSTQWGGDRPMQVHVVGRNGELPNMDLLNLATNAFQGEFELER